MKFSINDLFSNCDQICRKLRIWSHLLKKSLMENFNFCVLKHTNTPNINANFMINTLRHNISKVSEWFYEKYTVLYPDKSNFITLSFIYTFANFSLNKPCKDFTEEKILGAKTFGEKKRRSRRRF